MRRSSFQQVDVQISREIESQYDSVKVVADNIEVIEALADAITGGFDFSELIGLQPEFDALEITVGGKVDKVVGQGLSDQNYTAGEKAKLGLIAAEATKNSSDAELRDRTSHTGLQTLDTTTDTVTRVAMTPAERSKLGLVAAGANNYTHPSTHPISILDGTGNDGRFVKVDNVGSVGFDYVSWADVNGKPSAYTPAVHIHDMAEVVTGSIDASRVTTSTARRFVSDTQVGMVEGSEQVANKGQAGGYAPLNMAGKVELQYLSSLSILDVYTPANEASMLALSTAGIGDIAWRQDTQLASILVALPASVRENWKDLTLIGVTSVNGQQGVITLDTDGIVETTTTKYYTDERVDDRVAALLKAGTNISLTYDDVLGTLTLNVDDTYINWSEIQSKPSPVVTVTLTGDVTGTANATLTELGNGTITVATTVAANSVALGTDTIGNYAVGVTAGAGITVTGTEGEGWSPTIAHADTSSATSIASSNSNGVVIQDVTVTLDTYGHATAASVETIDLDTRYYTETEVQTVLPKVGFNTSNVTAPGTGQIAWNQDERTIDVGLNGVTLQVGQEQLINVRNSSGATILNKTVLMMTGTIGASGRITVAPFDGSDAKKILGLATEDFANGADGFVTTFGKVRGVDTSSWAEGSVLYTTTSGGLTSVPPISGVVIPIAVVVTTHASVGTLFVRVTPLDIKGLTRLDRADKYLALQNVAQMLYSDGNLVKIQYNNATDVDYEVLSYTLGSLTNIAHYVNSVLNGNTVLTYSSGTLVSAVFTGV